MDKIDRKLNVLIADDDKEDILIVGDMLADGLGKDSLLLTSVTNLKEFQDKVQKTSFDLCLVDLRLGVSSGFDLMKCLEEKNLDIPTIILTGQDDHNTAVEAMKRGAVDYVVKGQMNKESLTQAVQRALNLHREAVQRKRAEEELSVQSQRLQALSDSVLYLQRRDTLEGGIQEALKTLAPAMGADYFLVYTRENPKESGKSEYKLNHSWFNGLGSQKTEPGGNGFPKKLEGWVNIRQMELLQEGKILDQASHSNLEESLPGDSSGFSRFLFPLNIQDRFLGCLAVGGKFGLERPEAVHSILKTFSASLAWEIKRSNEEHTFRSLVQSTASQTGEGFFQALTRQLSLTIPTRCAYVYEVAEFGNTLGRLLAGWDGGPVSEVDLFDFVGTIGEDTLAGMFSFYRDSVREKFPKDPRLSSLKVNSYASVPFFDADSQVIGQIAVMDDQALCDRDRTLSILRLFASRAGAELVRMRAEERIRSMAYHDSLTGLPNRMLLNDRLNLALHQAQRHKTMIAVLYLDFDNFKHINDNYGHPLGDQLLKEGSSRLKNCLREADTVARLGGDEFVILLPEIKSTSDVAGVALKINGAFKAPFYLDDNEIKTTVSLGISLFPQDGDSSQKLLKMADDALLEAKNKGRDNFHFASPVKT